VRTRLLAIGQEVIAMTNADDTQAASPEPDTTVIERGTAVGSRTTTAS
jgi:hypothetical protein